MKEYAWNEDTIDYFVELYDLNGWAHVSQRALAFVLDDCEVQDGETYQDLFGDLINKIEDKILKEEYEWIEANRQDNELD
jgi:hypothetical protein